MKKNNYFFFFIVVSFLAYLLRLIPLFWAQLSKGGQVLNTFTLINTKDIWVYWAEMLMGKKGSWLFVKDFGAGSQETLFIKLPYILLGQLARFIPLRIEIVYFVASFLLFSSLLRLVFVFSGFFFSKPAWRLVVVSLIAFSSPPFFHIAPEVVPFLSLFLPHFILAQFLILAVFYLFLKRRYLKGEKERRKNIFLLFIVGLALSTIHAYISWLLVVILFLWLVFAPLFLKREKRDCLPFLILTLASLPMTLYFFYLSLSSEFFRYLMDSNQLFQPSWSHIFSWFLPLLIFLPFLLKRIKRNREALFVLFWLVIQFLFLFFPVGWRVRFLEGWWIAYVFLFVLAFHHFWTTEKRVIIKNLFLFLALTFGLLGVVAVNWAEVASIEFTKGDFFVSYEEEQAWSFLNPKCDFNKVILSFSERGVYLPARTGCRALVGHFHQTPSYHQEKELLAKFLNGEMGLLERKEFLIEKGIDYLFLSREEAEKSKVADLENASLVFENETFLIFEFDD